MTTNKDIITAIFAETAKGNGRPFVEAMAEDMVWRTIGGGSWSGRFVGKDTILREVFGRLSQRLEGPNTCVPTHILADGERVVVQARGRNRTKAGEAYENDYCFVIRMKNGKMVEYEEYCDTELVTAVLGDRL